MTSTALELLLRKWQTRAPIAESAAAAILALPAVERTYEPATYLIREGQTDLNRCGLILDGLAFRQKLTSGGSRQIVSLHVAGDMIDLQHLFLRVADHNVQALTRLETIDIDRRALRALILAEPSIAEAIWADTLIEASIYREWMTNIGRRDAKARVAHLLCELAMRTALVGRGDGRSCELPMTQEQIGDAIGLTSVHVNRTLRALVNDGIITRGARSVSFSDWDRIRDVAGFSSLYLHLDRGAH